MTIECTITRSCVCVRACVASCVCAYGHVGYHDIEGCTYIVYDDEIHPWTSHITHPSTDALRRDEGGWAHAHPSMPPPLLGFFFLGVIRVCVVRRAHDAWGGDWSITPLIASDSGRRTDPRGPRAKVVAALGDDYPNRNESFEVRVVT